MQRAIIILALVAIVLMCIYPPYQVFHSGRFISVGHTWLFDPPNRAWQVDAGRLGIQVILVLAVAGVASLVVSTLQRAGWRSSARGRVVRATSSAPTESPGDSPSTPPKVLIAAAPDSARNAAAAGPRGPYGWLLLLIVGFFIGPLYSAGQFASDIHAVESAYPGIVELPSWRSYTTVSGLVFVFIVVAGIYAGWSLLRKRTVRAVKDARIALWLIGPVTIFLLYVLFPSIFFDDYPVEGALLIQLPIAIVVAIVWTAYLSRSRRVTNTYGTAGK